MLKLSTRSVLPIQRALWPDLKISQSTVSANAATLHLHSLPSSIRHRTFTLHLQPVNVILLSGGATPIRARR